ncbi:phenylalanine--tRNA ligase subunit alpha [Samsonia erythrinae]|uniref:phenylalanine--tRNA ligase n=1 Tax=Samsonia erythrinae TaxID=160434 RepID=A0A4R3VMB7_9GAMM|nr:phenylalanine--tRNA ligase subunit alpha [Samsonia erythrinae]TCV07706.1 phenylalanyl-tRNA synthetase alpha subunit [Samsonia erythrinae]
MDAAPLTVPRPRHPLGALTADILAFFQREGYSQAQGSELETAWFNFDVLNMPETHFARAGDHTFYIAHPDYPERQSGLVLRAHTSPVQARTMLHNTPPFYNVHIGRTFRPDALDSTHSPVFNQLEGFAVDKGLSMDDLKRQLDRFAHFLFGEGIVTRLRPYTFSYADPAAEIDIQCPICKGKTTPCATCHSEGWIEWGGCGMVHPAVLRNCGIDPQTHQAFAFGIGVERTLMLRDGIRDLRQIVDGDVRYAQSATLAIEARATQPQQRAEQAMRARGFIEITRFPFLDVQELARLGMASEDARWRYLSLLNPLQGYGEILRTTLLPGLLSAWQCNLSALEETNSAIFESGSVFFAPDPLIEPPAIALGRRPSADELEQMDNAVPEQPLYMAAIANYQGNWSALVDVVSHVLECLGVRSDIHPATCSPWTAGKCVAVAQGNATMGFAGEIAPGLLKTLGLPTGLCAMEINLSALLENHTHKEKI